MLTLHCGLRVPVRRLLSKFLRAPRWAVQPQSKRTKRIHSAREGQRKLAACQCGKGDVHRKPFAASCHLSTYKCVKLGSTQVPGIVPVT